MPTNKVSTELHVKAKPEGFSRLRDETARTNEALKRGTQGQKKALSEAEKEAKLLARQLDQAGRGLEKMESKVRKLEKALKDANQARGAFMQGLAQGTGMGEFIQRGPGMGRQVMGIQAGKALMAPSRLIGGAAFGGVSGFTSAMRQLPLGMGMASVPLAAALGMAQQGVGYQRSLLQAAPYLNQGRGGSRALDQGAITQAGDQAAASAARQAGANPIEGRVRANVHESLQAMAARQSYESAPTDLRTSGVDVTGAQLTIREKRRQQHLAALEANPTVMRNLEDRARVELGAQDSRQTVTEARAAAERQEAGRQAGERRRSAQQRMTGGIAKIGLDYGAMDMQQTLQTASQLRQTIGGVGALEGGDLKAAIAAQTALGVDTGVSGQFLKTGRSGGMVGGGSGKGNLEEALSQGMRLGLEGSELTDYMQRMAQGIQQFQQSGIPINPGSIGEMGAVLKAGGIGGVRAGMMAGTVQQWGSQVAQRGPQSALDVMGLQAVGFKGGGMKDVFSSMRALEEGMTGEQLGGMLEKMGKLGGSGAEGEEKGALLIQRMMQNMGGSIGLGEAQTLSQAARAGGLPERMKEMDLAQSKGPGSQAASVEQLAKNMVETLAPGVKQTAATTNKQIDVGQSMVGTMNKLERTMVDVASSARNLASKDIERVAAGIEGLAKALDVLTRPAHGEAGSTGLNKLLEALEGLRTG